jgi:hypothetical protein
MERLETEKRMLQEKLDQPLSPRTNSTPGAPIAPPLLRPPSQQQQTGSSSYPNGFSIGASLLGLSQPGLGLTSQVSSDQATSIAEYNINLRREVARLKLNLEKAERENKENMEKLVKEEKAIRDENLRLQRRLQMEVDRREALCRHLSESESSLEMDDERHFNESSRIRTVSSPLPGYLMQQQQQQHQQQSVPTTSTSTTPTSMNNNQIFSHPSMIPSASAAGQQVERCVTCNQIKMPHLLSNMTSSPPPFNTSQSSRQQKGGLTTNTNNTLSSGNLNTNIVSSSLSASSSLSSINSINNIKSMNPSQQ